jgi:hypothetical protein
MDPSNPNPAAGGLTEWALASLPWLAALLVLATSVGAVGVWVLVQRAKELGRLGGRAEALERIERSLAGLAAERQDLDLRRIEHVLLEIRDNQRRVEDALLRAVQSGPRLDRQGGRVQEPHGAGLAERVTNRLLALGYERVQLVTSPAEIESIATDGEVQVEARRDGVLHKGRVVVRGRSLTEVEMKPAYTVFP